MERYLKEPRMANKVHVHKLVAPGPSPKQARQGRLITRLGLGSKLQISNLISSAFPLSQQTPHSRGYALRDK